MSFSQDFIEKVRDASNIVDIIGQYTSLKGNGPRYMALCPFPDHNEKSPSFSISEDRQLYHCFGCGKGGNIFTFLETYQGLSFPEGVEYLAERAGIPIEKVEKKKFRPSSQSRSSGGEKDFKKSLLQINRLAKSYYQHCLSKLPENHEYNKYIQSRKITAELIELFHIGISPAAWQALTNVMQKRNVPVKLAAQLGLLKEKKQGGEYFDIFRERLIFPILSPTGDTLGFGGRVLGDDHPKYLNSPETPVFHKGRTLYGLHETAKHIRVADEVIVVEGYMDLIALYAVGIKNTVAILGTALTEDHARKLKRYTKNVVLLLDGDAAGQRAAERSLVALLSQELFVRNARLEEGMDPDDFIQQKGVEALLEVIKKAPDHVSQSMNDCFRGYTGLPQEKVQRIDQLAPILAQVKDQRLRSLYFEDLRDRLGVEADWLKKALQSAKTVKLAQNAARNTPQSIGMDEPPMPSEPMGPMDEDLEGHFGMDPGLAEAELEPSSGHPAEQRWAVSQLHKFEQELLKLALHSAENFQKIKAAEVEDQVSPILRSILEWMAIQHGGPSAAESEGENGQTLENFDKLPALLASMVDVPSIVTEPISSTDFGGSRSTDSKLVEDCLKRLKERFLGSKTKNLVREWGHQPSQEDLERFMNIQREKRSQSNPKK